jgi:hypothetical protein
MNKKWLIAIVPGILAVIALVFLVALFLIKVLWAWTISDLFPGAVEQGLVAGDISWLTAFKLAIFVALLAGIARIRQGNMSDRHYLLGLQEVKRLVPTD